MKRFYISIAFILLITFQLINAQTIQLSGKVTSPEDGMPLPGVTIVVKGTTVGSISDLDGNYSLQVPADARILIFSFVGMKTLEVAIDNRTVIDIVMESDVVGLDEVVVAAIGIHRE